MLKLYAKFILLGDGGVGKSSIRRQYMGEGFRKSHLMTIGADFSNKIQIIDNKFQVSTQIWDLAGQVQFKSVRKRFYLGASGVMLVYDITSRESFTNITNWFQELIDNSFNKNNAKKIPIIFIGNKIDLVEQREVSVDNVKAYIQTLKRVPELSHIPMYNIETSALDGTNIEEVFEKLARLIIDNNKPTKPIALKKK